MTNLLLPTSSYRELTIEEILRRKAVADAFGYSDPLPAETSEAGKYKGLGIDYGILFTDTNNHLSALVSEKTIVPLQDKCDSVYYDTIDEAHYFANDTLGTVDGGMLMNPGVACIKRILRDKDKVLFVGETGRMRTLGHAHGYTLTNGISLVQDAVMYNDVPHFIRNDKDGPSFLSVYVDEFQYDDIMELDAPSGLVDGGGTLYVISGREMWYYNTLRFDCVGSRIFTRPIGPMLFVREQERDLMYLGVKDGPRILWEDVSTLKLPFHYDVGSNAGVGIKSMTAAPIEYINEMIARNERSGDAPKSKSGIWAGTG